LKLVSQSTGQLPEIGTALGSGAEAVNLAISLTLFCKCTLDEVLSIRQQRNGHIEDIACCFDCLQGGDVLVLQLLCNILDHLGKFFCIELLEGPGKPNLERIEVEACIFVALALSYQDCFSIRTTSHKLPGREEGFIEMVGVLDRMAYTADQLHGKVVVDDLQGFLQHLADDGPIVLRLLIGKAERDGQMM